MERSDKLQDELFVELVDKNIIRFIQTKNSLTESIDDTYLLKLNCKDDFDLRDDSKLRYLFVNNISTPHIILETRYKQFLKSSRLKEKCPMRDNWHYIEKMKWEEIEEINGIGEGIEVDEIYFDTEEVKSIEQKNISKVNQNLLLVDPVIKNNLLVEEEIYDLLVDDEIYDLLIETSQEENILEDDKENIKNNSRGEESEIEDYDFPQNNQLSLPDNDNLLFLQDNDNQMSIDNSIFINGDNPPLLENGDNSSFSSPINDPEKTNYSDSDIEYLEMDEETLEIKKNINKIKSEIRRVEPNDNKREMLFFIDKCIECKNNITDICLDLKLCPNTYNVNVGTRIYSLMKVDHNCDLTIFDVLQSLCVIDDSLQSFMKSYKVLQITGIIIHPLTKVKEVSPVDKYVIVTNITNIDLGIDSNILRNRKILGLRNLGNTCFMNSSLQAIINCKEFSDYFYCVNINKNKKLSNAFSELVKKFDKSTDYVVPYNFRQILGSKVEIYTENNEQDAMEFITDLLDIIHEEIKIKKRSKMEDLDSYNQWQIENQSLITNLFFIKIKSSIICSGCNQGQSIYEPCLYLPVPVPLKKKYFSNIVIFYESSNRVPLKIFAEENMTIYDLKEMLRSNYNVENEILCVQLQNNNMVKICDSTVLKNMKNTLFCYEYIKDDADKYFWIKISKKYFFWTTYFDFWILGKTDTKVITGDSTNVITGDTTNVITGDTTNVITGEIVKDIIRTRFTPFLDDFRNYDSFFNSSFQIDHENTSFLFPKQIIKLTISNSSFNKIFGSNFNPLKNMYSLNSDKIDLNTCINLFLEREYIFGDDTQLCAFCNNYTIHYKDTELDKLPKYLIIQLKRFRFTGVSFEKVDTFVDFDLHEFDIKGSKYKVISVINHIAPVNAFRSVGSNGHYTSYVRYQDEWYLCNDESVKKVNEVKKEEAYIFVLEKID